MSVRSRFSSDRRIRHPGPLIIGAFGAVIVIGTLLLALPVSHRSGVVAPTLGDALFTAVSAVTVTGLVVVDTGTAWSPFGEIVLVTLIQIGGLGIMTLAGFLGLALNQRLGLRGTVLAGTEIGVTVLGDLKVLLRNIVRFVFVSEATVAVLLTGRFLVDGEPITRSIHLGVFHAVSAFNNAGFSVIAGGLEPYVGDWYVNLVVAACFILGGLGFPVVFELRRVWRSPRRWSLHTKVTMATTGALLAFGTVAIGAVEWNNSGTLRALDLDERILASFFQSATARTAGFNTLDTHDLRPASWMVLVLLMVVGAGSASTGGGIKTSTFAVAIRSAMAELRGDPSTTLFHRRIAEPVERQALALVITALGTVGTATFVLAAAHETRPVGELLFEAASAFGTVGMSTGVTPELDTIGRFVIVVLMFVGRVGPITFGTAVLLRPQRRRYGYPGEDLLIG